MFKRALEERGEDGEVGFFIRECSGRKRGNDFKPKEDRFRLDIRKKTDCPCSHCQPAYENFCGSNLHLWLSSLVPPSLYMLPEY